MKRFYKATDGKITVYRGTETREYRSVTFSSIHLGPADGPGLQAGWYRKGSIGFSAAAPAGTRSAWGAQHPTEEIVQSEYETLVALRNTWLQSRGINPKDRTSPQDSWLPNAIIADYQRTVGWAERTDDDPAPSGGFRLTNRPFTNPAYAHSPEAAAEDERAEALIARKSTSSARRVILNEELARAEVEIDRIDAERTRANGWDRVEAGFEHDAAMEQGPASRDKAVPDYGDDPLPQGHESAGRKVSAEEIEAHIEYLKAHDDANPPE